MHTDFFLRAEGHSLLFTDAQSRQLDWQDDTVWMQAVNDGALFPFALSEKYAVGLRVRVGELDATEEVGWLGRVRWKIALPTGRLVAASGWEGLSQEHTDGETTATLDVPAGSYEAVMHSMVTRFNAKFCLMGADGVGWNEQQTFGSWWRESRSDEDFPDWLRALCVMAPDNDPEHQDTWQKLEMDEVRRLMKLWESRPWVDYVLQLRLLSTEPEQPSLDAGMLIETEVRRTAVCPDALHRD